VLDREASRYVARVHRRRPGDRLLLFDPEARLEADATVLAVGREVQVLVAAPRPPASPGGLPVTVLQAVGKGEKVDRVVRDATALGAARVVVGQGPASCRRSTGPGRSRRRSSGSRPTPGRASASIRAGARSGSCSTRGGRPSPS